MRKHKSVVAILLAVMMIFTFMPTMAFAAENDVTWAKDYSTATVEKATGSVTFNTIREFNTSTGMVDANADTSEYEGYLPEENLTISYYDLNNSVFGLSDSNRNHKAIVSTYANVSVWEARGQVRGLFFSAPSYVKNNTTSDTCYVSFNDGYGQGLSYLGDWGGTVKYTMDGVDYNYTALNAELEKATEDKTFEVWFDVDYNATRDSKTPVYGAIPSKTVTVKGPVKGNPSNVKLYVDKVEEGKEVTSPISVTYDGSEHTIVASDVKGYTIKWTVYNKKTGEWEPVDSVKVKDVTTSAVDAKILFYDNSITGTQTPAERKIKVSVAANTYAPEFDFDRDPAPAVGDFDVPAGEEYNPLDYVLVYPYANTTTKTDDKAVAANEKELLAYFAEYAKFTTTTKKASPNYEFVKFALNEDLTQADLKALDKKYETLIRNLGLAANGGSIGTATASFYRTPEAVDYEVVFTNAPSTVSYKGKKGKLKKTKSFTVTAVANNGETVFYKLVNADTPKVSIDKTTGKVTVKKGLKKGTYKMQVKAYTLKSGAWETQNITIKIKK
jgi:hypothetical protein